MSGKLYIVATPIGNLSDMTMRGIEVLKTVDTVFAEDTRKTSILLSHFDVHKPIRSYHQHSLLAKKEEICKALLDGKNIAIVTDAGTPGISDPGNELIDYILSILPTDVIVPVPGASSLTAALSVCGFNVQKFVFIGFFPRKKKQKLIEWTRQGKASFAFFESPHRIYKTLAELSQHMGSETRVCVCREMTKIHESIYRGRLIDIAKEFEGKKTKGEIVVIVEGK